MSVKKSKKQRPYEAAAKEPDASRPGAFWGKLAPEEPDGNPAVRSWRNAAGWGLAALAFLVPPLVTLNYGSVVFGNAIIGKEYLLRLSAIFWLVFASVSLAYGYRFAPTRRAYPLIALTAAYLAWIPFSRHPNYTVPKSAIVVACAILFFAIATLGQRGKILAARATVFGGFLSVIITAALSLAPSSVLNITAKTSLFALTDTFGNENMYAIFLLAMIPLAVFVTGSLWERGSQGLAGVCAFFILAAAAEFVFTYSRGGYLGAVAAVIAWLTPFSLRKTLKAGAAFIVVTAIAVGAIFALQEKYPFFHEKLTNAPQAARERMEIWNIGLGVFAENPAFGAGPGSLQVKSLDRKSDALIEKTHAGRLVDAHNDIITFALETGIGVVFYLIFIGSILYEGSKRRDAFGKLAFAGFAGIFTVSFFTSASAQASTLFYPLLLGAILAGKDDYIVVSKNAASRPGAALGYSLAALLLFLVWWTYADFRETVGYATFERMTLSEPATPAELEPQLRVISDVYPQNPVRYKHEALISLKRAELTRFLEMSKEFYERDPAEISASFNYGYALLLNGRPKEAEPLLVDSLKVSEDNNPLLPALLYVVYNELGDEKKAAVFMKKAHTSETFVQPEKVLAKLRQMKIVKR